MPGDPAYNNISHFGNYFYLCKKAVLRIIAKKTLRDFWQKHPDCEQQLKTWYLESSKSNWISPKEIKIEYPGASFLQGNRVVFNIKGNTYRLIVRINYSYGIIWIRFIGTHAQYGKVDASKI
jgi:mRNA interferase HigB